ncbi:MAG: DUF6754 domain-containing protein [candidate division WOR-3 bacterium]|nr:DUF6754 domain-containing protein [candidate division WOR-3 bacterium]
MKKLCYLLLIMLLVGAYPALHAQTGTMPLDPDTAYSDTIPTEIVLRAEDTPNDAGSAITVTWECNDNLPSGLITIVRINGEEESIVAEDLMLTKEQVRDTDVADDKEYSYYGIITSPDNKYYRTKDSNPAKSEAQWFNTDRTDSFVAVLFITLVFVWFIQQAKKGKSFYIRKINGLDAIEEAVGRSTEMGKPIMYILGIGYVTDIPTIAGLTILSRVAKKAAEYDTSVLVPCYDPVVMTTAQEVVKESFTEAGRPDAYQKEDTMYITQDQFGYAAGVDGMMMREKPGAVFLQGLFFAESLILAETGHSIGAIQIAGTTETAQLPFFVAACDYTLIGEEMMAASVYMDKNPLMLGSIVAEDMVKVLIIVILFIGLLLGILGPGLGIDIFNNWFEWLIRII